MSSWYSIIKFAISSALIVVSFTRALHASQEGPGVVSTESRESVTSALAKPTSIMIDKRTIVGITEVKLLPRGKVKLTFSGGSGAWPIDAFPARFLESWGLEIPATGEDRSRRNAQEEKLRVLEESLRKIPTLCEFDTLLKSLDKLDWRIVEPNREDLRDFFGELSLNRTTNQLETVKLFKVEATNQDKSSEVVVCRLGFRVIRVRVTATIEGFDTVEDNGDRMKHFGATAMIVGRAIGLPEEQVVDWWLNTMRLFIRRQPTRMLEDKLIKDIQLRFTGGVIVIKNQAALAVNFTSNEWLELKKKLERFYVQ